MVPAASVARPQLSLPGKARASWCQGVARRKAPKLLSRLNARAALARLVRADVTVETDIANMVAFTTKTFGKLDMFNNAGFE